MKVRFRDRIKELIRVEAPSILNCFTNGIFKACDQVSEQKIDRKVHGKYFVVRWGGKRCNTTKESGM